MRRRHQTRAKGVLIAGNAADVMLPAEVLRGPGTWRYKHVSAQGSLSTAGEPRMGESRTPTQDHHEVASRRLAARSYIPKGRRKRPRLPFIMPLICFIIFRLSPNCLTMRLTSSILRPAPFAMRVFRRMSITSGWVRS